MLRHKLAEAHIFGPEQRQACVSIICQKSPIIIRQTRPIIFEKRPANSSSPEICDLLIAGHKLVNKSLDLSLHALCLAPSCARQHIGEEVSLFFKMASCVHVTHRSVTMCLVTRYTRRPRGCVCALFCGGRVGRVEQWRGSVRCWGNARGVA